MPAISASFSQSECDTEEEESSTEEEEQEEEHHTGSYNHPWSLGNNRKSRRCSRRAIGLHRAIMAELQQCQPCMTATDAFTRGIEEKETNHMELLHQRIRKLLSANEQRPPLLHKYGIQERDLPGMGKHRINAKNTQFTAFAQQIGGRAICDMHSDPTVCLRRTALAAISCNANYFSTLLVDVASESTKGRRNQHHKIDLDKYLRRMDDDQKDGDIVTLQALSDVTGVTVNVLKWTLARKMWTLRKILPRELAQLPTILRNISKAINLAGQEIWLSFRGPGHGVYRSLHLVSSRFVSSSLLKKERSQVLKQHFAETTPSADTPAGSRRPVTRSCSSSTEPHSRVASTGRKSPLTMSLYGLCEQNNVTVKSRTRKAAMEAARKICDFLQLESRRQTVSIEINSSTCTKTGKIDALLSLAAGSERPQYSEEEMHRKRRKIKETVDNRAITESKKIDSPTDCIICTDIVENGEQGVLDTCDHRYHYECIMRWSKISNKCPICKRIVSVVQRRQWTEAGAEEVVHEEHIPVPENLIEEHIAVEWVPTVRGTMVPSYNGYTREELDADCYVCRDGGDPSMLLLCDGRCGRGAHCHCVGLDCIPEGEWFCYECEEIKRRQLLGLDASEHQYSEPDADSVEQIVIPGRTHRNRGSNRNDRSFSSCSLLSLSRR